MLDAAVSGSVPQVEQGNLVIFVGGEQETYQRRRPLLEPLGSSIFYVGASGSGTTESRLVADACSGWGCRRWLKRSHWARKRGWREQAT